MAPRRTGTVGEETRERNREQIRELAARGLSVEVIARTVGTTRYQVETVVERGPAGRNDVPYRHRELLEGADVVARYLAGDSVEELARCVGVSTAAVYAALHRAGVALRGTKGPHVPDFGEVLTAEFLRAEYVEGGRSCAELAGEVGCSEATVRNWRRRHGIPARGPAQRRRAYQFPGELLDAVAAGTVTVAEASAAVGCSRSEFERALRRSGRLLPSQRRAPLTAELLTDLYVAQSRTCPQIAEVTGWSAQTIRARLRELGIPRRRGVQGRSV
jgi:transposase-like protein